MKVEQPKKLIDKLSEENLQIYISCKEKILYNRIEEMKKMQP